MCCFLHYNTLGPIFVSLTCGHATGAAAAARQWNHDHGESNELDSVEYKKCPQSIDCEYPADCREDENHRSKEKPVGAFPTVRSLWPYLAVFHYYGWWLRIVHWLWSIGWWILWWIKMSVWCRWYSIRNMVVALHATWARVFYTRGARNVARGKYIWRGGEWDLGWRCRCQQWKR
jgi:hypothetical protein